MPEPNDNIELRSEKVRSIIGQIPSRIVRSGITVLFMIVMLLLTGSYFFHYPDVVKGTAYLCADNTNQYAKISLPYRFIGKIKKDQRVNIELEGYPANNFGLLKGCVTQVFPSPLKKNGKSYFMVQVKLTNGMISTQNRNIPFYPNLQGNAKITVGEQRLLEKLLSPIVNIFKSKKRNTDVTNSTNTQR